MSGLHADELRISEELVRRLVHRSFPAYASCDIAALGSSGSSNALFRLGSELVVRLPRQPGGGATIEHEARWLPCVAKAVATRVPEMVGVGLPAEGYVEKWCITRWLDGSAPSVTSDRGPSSALARDLAQFVGQLRAMDLPDTVTPDDGLSSYRGGSLASLDSDFRSAVADCRSLPFDPDWDEALRVWDQAVVAGLSASSPRTWLHGDLLAENLLVTRGRLSAVLDFGGLAIGDPTVDLVVAWELLDADGRKAFRQYLDVDDATWTASRGWALLIAAITFPYYGHTMPRRCADRLVMARAAILGD